MAKQRGIHQYEVLAICTLVAHLSTAGEHVGMLLRDYTKQPTTRRRGLDSKAGDSD
ncbi:hypothetical protein [Vibrio chagasii]|uniref:hypothetical protein n=1 Tax=Vibrio chagasii TaxID=170679 RepID=UPI00147698B1|nr:hypothetical protein [Vibrio chagasii]